MTAFIVVMYCSNLQIAVQRFVTTERFPGVYHLISPFPATWEVQLIQLEIANQIPLFLCNSILQIKRFK